MKKFGFQFAEGPLHLREPEPSEPQNTIDLSYVLTVLRRRRAILIWHIVLWMLLGVGYTITTPKFYDASATVLLDRNIDRAIQQVSDTGDLTMNNAAMESARLVITSDQVARRVATELQLHKNAAFVEPPVSLLSEVIGTALATIRRPLGWLRLQFADKGELAATGEQRLLTPQEIEGLQTDLVVQELQRELGVFRVGQSSAFYLSYRSYSAELAASVVNEFAETYVSDTLNANFEATERMTEWMQGRLLKLETDARLAAQEAEEFRAANGLVSNRDSTISQEAVARLNVDLSEAVGNEARSRAQVAAIEAILAQEGTLRLTGLPAINDEDLVQRQRAYANAVTNADRIAKVDGTDTPRAQRAQQFVEAAEVRLLEAINRLAEQARGGLALAEARVSALRDSLQNAVAEDVDSGAAMVRLRTLEQRALTLSTLYQTFLAKFQEVEQQKSFPISNVRILKAAVVPRFATGPRTSKTMVFCIIFGLFTGLILMAISEWKDRFLRTAGQVKTELRMPFLGYLPRIATVQKPKQQVGRDGRSWLGHLDEKGGSVIPLGSPLYTLANPRSHYTETMRGIRLSSQLAIPVDQPRIIGVSSAQPGEGKSLTALNLAATIDASGASVVLVDVDVHRYGLSRLLASQGDPGLLQVLTGSSSMEDVVQKIPVTNVDFIPCAVPEEFHYASELLANERMLQLLEQLRKHYEFIILDMAPMAPVIDVRMLLPAIDQLVMVTEWGKTKKSLVNTVLTTEPALQEKLLGIVLTKVDLNRLSAYINEDDANANLSQYDSYVTAR